MLMCLQLDTGHTLQICATSYMNLQLHQNPVRCWTDENIFSFLNQKNTTIVDLNLKNKSKNLNKYHSENETDKDVATIET